MCKPRNRLRNDPRNCRRRAEKLPCAAPPGRHALQAGAERGWASGIAAPVTQREAYAPRADEDAPPRKDTTLPDELPSEPT
jgi:hypothetical protein